MNTHTYTAATNKHAEDAAAAVKRADEEAARRARFSLLALLPTKVQILTHPQRKGPREQREQRSAGTLTQLLVEQYKISNKYLTGLYRM